MYSEGDLFRTIESHDGEVELWICAFDSDDLLKKARRNVKPTKVLARWTAEQRQFLAGNRESLSYREKKIELIPYKDDKLQRTSISYKNIHFFFDEDVCVNQYNDWIFEAIKKFEDQRERTIKQCNNKIEQLKESFVKSDYVMETLTRN